VVEDGGLGDLGDHVPGVVSDLCQGKSGIGSLQHGIPLHSVILNVFGPIRFLVIGDHNEFQKV
jgi:hypothetical protein